MLCKHLFPLFKDVHSARHWNEMMCNQTVCVINCDKRYELFTGLNLTQKSKTIPLHFMVFFTMPDC